MKLYATTTSERASKGQGGNNYIKALFTVDKNPKSEMLVILCTHENGDVSFAVNQKTDDGYIEVYRNLYKTKGKSQKSECLNTGRKQDGFGLCKECNTFHYRKV